jgi:hypothetical protein
MPCAALGFQAVRSHGLTTAWCPLARYTTPAANIARMARPYSANTMLTRFWVTRKRSMATRADAAISPMIAAPCHWIGQPLTAGNAKPRNATIDVPVATITSTPGHHAQKPAKNPQNGPNALCVHR